jgi:hypothetical protein
MKADLAYALDGTIVPAPVGAVCPIRFLYQLAALMVQDGRGSLL